MIKRCNLNCWMYWLNIKRCSIATGCSGRTHPLPTLDLEVESKRRDHEWTTFSA